MIYALASQITPSPDAGMAVPARVEAYKASYAASPLASSQGLKITSMNLGGNEEHYMMSIKEKPKYEIRLLDELRELQNVSDIIVITELNLYWLSVAVAIPAQGLLNL